MITIFSYLPRGFIEWLLGIGHDVLACKIFRDCPDEEKVSKHEIDLLIKDMARSDTNNPHLILY
jgi:hypothetical protein